MNATTTIAGSILVFVLVSAGSMGRPACAATPPSYDRRVVAKGAELAAIGNCATCHTRADGKSFAGGRPLATPFGTIYSTNITPDPGTGIGDYTEADFRRAMHEGVARDGRQLYPAFPYDHFTRVADDDIAALYAFFMTREPARAEAPPNRLRFPASSRPLISLWKAMYFRPGVYRPDAAQSAEWNRGAYLVEGLAHCGACHTPRNMLGAERTRHALEGGDAEGWHATALASDSPAPTRWTVDQLVAYLRRGYEREHGIAAGPMADVTHNLADVSEADVRAIAVYVVSRMPDKRSAPPAAQRSASADGEQIFAGACAVCHDAPRPAASEASTPLGLTTSLNAPDPRNAIHVIIEGLEPEAGEKGALMPGFAGELTDAQIAALVDYLRARFTDRPAWRDVARQVAAIRSARKEPL
jgi:mono/diheme cytochrome c family protein